MDGGDTLIRKWRRGTGDLDPVSIDGDITYKHVSDILRLAYEYGIPNVFVTPGRPVEGTPSAGPFVRLTDRNMIGRDVELFARVLWKAGDPVTEMMQGKAIDFRYDLRLPDGNYLMFRGSMSSSDGVGVENYTIAIRTFATSPPLWEDLHIEPQITQMLLPPKKGIIAFVGATDSGKTTMQASAINYIARHTPDAINCLEYGSPLEYPQRLEDNKKFRYVGINLNINLRLPDDWTGGDISYACSNSMRGAPGLVSISECRTDMAFRGVVELATTGTPVMTTLHAKGPSSSISRMCLASEANRDAFAADVLSAFRMIVHQMLTRSANGGRVGVREFLIFTKEMKKEIRSVSHDKWEGVIDEIMQTDDPEHVQTFDQHLTRLVGSGDITEATRQDVLSIIHEGS